MIQDTHTHTQKEEEKDVINKIECSFLSIILTSNFKVATRQPVKV